MDRYYLVCKLRASRGIKAAFFSRQDGNTSKENVLTDNEICVLVKCKNERARSENIRAQLRENIRAHDDRAQNLTNQSRDENAQSQVERAQNKDERNEIQHQHAVRDDERSQNQYERAQSKDERTVSGDQRVESQDQRSENQHHRANQDDSAEKLLDIQNRSTMNVTHNRVTTHRKALPAKRTKFQSVNNAKEQSFLNTIIIIACIAVITVMLGTIGGQLHELVEKELPVI